MSAVSNLVVRPARSEDFERVRELLTVHSLPLDGVPAALGGFVVAEEDSRIVGVAGVEDCDGDALLRSVAVDPSERDRGIGGQLVRRLIDDARSEGRRTIYLLTTTAEGYFPAFGFVKISRHEAPQGIQANRQFTDLCPSSATIMKLVL